MRILPNPPKPRRDSLIGQRLTRDQQDDLYDRLDKGLTFEAARKFLWETYEVKLSGHAIWKWNDRRRRHECDRSFSRLLQNIRADQEEAIALGREIGSAQELNNANVLLLSQALFECRRKDNLTETTHVARLFTSVLGAVDKTHRTEIVRNRFHFDAAQAALIHSAELQALNADDSLDQRERIARAIKQLFGEALGEPADPAPPPLALADPS